MFFILVIKLEITMAVLDIFFNHQNISHLGLHSVGHIAVRGI
jgi:hypothetical protein